MGIWLLPWRRHILSIPWEAGCGTSAEIYGLDDVFHPDDLGSDPFTQVFIIYILCIIRNWYKLFLRDIYRVSVTMAVCRIMRNCYSFLLGFNCIFNCVVQDSLHYSLDKGTLCIAQLRPITLYKTVFLGVRCSGIGCQYEFLLLIPW